MLYSVYTVPAAGTDVSVWAVLLQLELKSHKLAVAH